MVNTTLIALIFAAVALGAFGTLTVTVYAQEPSAVSELTALIVQMSILIGAVASVVSIVASKFLAKHGDNKLLKDIVTGADYLGGTDDEVIENKEDIGTIIDVFAKLIPGAREELEKRKPEIIKTRQKAEELKEEVSRIQEVAERL